MKVRESNGERMVWLASSESNPSKEYRVDLTAMGGAGQCQCADWTMRRATAIAKGLPLGTRLTCCKHILEVRRIFLNQCLKALAEQDDRTG